MSGRSDRDDQFADVAAQVLADAAATCRRLGRDADRLHTLAESWRDSEDAESVALYLDDTTKCFNRLARNFDRMGGVVETAGLPALDDEELDADPTGPEQTPADDPSDPRNAL